MSTRSIALPRRPVAALVFALALTAGCGGGGEGDDRVGTDTGGDSPPAETSGGDTGSECRTEIVEDEYGFEVEVEVCD